MNLPQVTIVSLNYDWQGLYVNGKLEYQGHSIQPLHIFRALGVNWDSKEIENTEMSHLPDTLKELE